MADKTVTVLCTYSDIDIDPEKLLQQSFQLFLQKELFTLAIHPPM